MAWIVLKHVEPERAVNIRRVEIDNILVPLRRNHGEHIKNVVAVRVNEADSLASLDVLLDERLEESRLSGSCLPNDVEMPKAVLVRQAHFGSGAAEGIGTQ